MKFLDSRTKIHIYFTNARKNFAYKSKKLKTDSQKITTRSLK